MNNGWIISRLKTHIDIYARVGENSGVRGVGWDVSVELLTIPIPATRICQKTELKITLRFSPLDAVQLVPLHVIVAHQLHPVGEDCMGRDGLLGQSDCPDSWRQHFIILIIMRLAWNRINSSAPPRDKIRDVSMEITVDQIIVSKRGGVLIIFFLLVNSFRQFVLITDSKWKGCFNRRKILE